jgi:hypothetical protein
MVVWQVTTLFLARLFAALTRAGGAVPAGPLAGVWMGLYQPPTGPPTQQTLMGSITEANYDGYSRQQVVWFPTWLSAGGPQVLQAQDLWFSPIDALKPNLITGIFLADAFYGGNLLMAAPLATPGVTLYGPGAALKVQAVYQQGFGALYGGPVVQS